MARWLDPTVYTVSGRVRNGHLSLSQSLAHRSETSFSMGASVHGVSALRSWPPAHISLARTTWSSGATPTFSFLPGRSPPALAIVGRAATFPCGSFYFFGQVAALSSGPPSAWPLRPLPLPRQLWGFEFPFDSSGLLDLRLPWIWRSASSSTAVWLLWVVLPLRRLSSRAAAPPWVATGLASWARLFVGCLELYPLSPWQPV